MTVAVPRPLALCVLAAALAGCSAAPAAPLQPVAAVSPRSEPLFYNQLHVHPTFEPGLAPFSIRVGDIESSLTTLPTFVMPGSVVEVAASGGSGHFYASSDVGHVTAGEGASWQWTAPSAPGDHAIRIRDTARGGEILLRVFVLEPYDGSGHLAGRRVGHYVDHAKDDDPAYRRPPGFVVVTPSNVDLAVSPHFRLGQFLCKDADDWPRYVALRTELFVKLETLLAALASRGLPASSLHVMSGYRTPAYNSSIGNETSMSRHLYGDAADVFLDRDNDGIEDDLNNDGASTRADARVLYDIAEEALDGALPGSLAGGLSAYDPTDTHGPFLHVDARGHRARW